MPPQRTYLLICGIGSLAGAASYTLFLPYQIQVAHLDALQIVLTGTVMEGVCFVTQVPTGVLADLYGRKRSIVVGYFLMGAGLLVMAAVPSFPAILVGHGIWGLGATCVDGALEAWAAAEIGESRVGRVFARGSQLGQIGGILGTVAAVALASVSPATPTVAGGVLTVLLAPFLAVFMSERNFVAPASAPLAGLGRRRPHGTAMRDQLKVAGRTIRRSRALTALVAAALFIGLSSEGIDRLSQPHFLLDLQFPHSASPAVWLGGMGIASTLAGVALTDVIRRRIDRLGTDGLSRWLATLTLGAVCALLVFAMVGSFWPAVVASMLVGLFRSAGSPLVAAWLVKASDPASRATVFSLQSQLDSAGQLVGGPPIGVVGQRFSIGAALSVSALLMVPAALCYRFAVIRQPAGRGGDDVSVSRGSP